MRIRFLLLCIVFITASLNASRNAPDQLQEIEVKIETSDPSIILAGTLTIPVEVYNGTVVLMITGSGDHTRDQVISGTPMFKIMAERLASAGIASLRLDDRGTGESTGPTTTESTTADRVKDMSAALEWLRRGVEVNFTNVGVMGHSEGALIAIVLASLDVQPDFAILLAAPARAGGEVWVSQQMEGLRKGGFDDEAVRTGEKLLREAVRLSAGGAEPDEMTDNAKQLFLLIGIDPESEQGKANIHNFVTRMSNPWMRYFLHYDPSDDLKKLAIPVMAIYGSHDIHTIPAQNVPGLVEGLIAAANTNYAIRILPEQDHFFLRKPGEPLGVHIFKEMVLSSDLIEEVDHFIKTLK